jgi:hypothetical protein
MSDDGRTVGSAIVSTVTNRSEDACKWSCGRKDVRHGIACLHLAGHHIAI